MAVQDERPNVLFIICDDLNTAIEGFGRKPCAPAPNLQRLLRRGMRFQNAQNNCPICLPSRSSMLSGMYPHTTGHYTLWDDWRASVHIKTTGDPTRPHWRQQLLGTGVWLPHHFRRNGYQTFGVGKFAHEGETDPEWWTQYAYGPDYGPFAWDSVRKWQAKHPDRLWMYEGEPMLSYTQRYAGVDRFFLNGDQFRHQIELNFGSLEEILGTGAELRSTRCGTYRYVSDEDRDPLPDERTTAWAVDVLGRQHEDPFFLAVGYMKPHTPLNVPQRFFDLFPPDELELPPVLEGDCDDCARALVEHRPYGFLVYEILQKGGEAVWRKWLQAYLACVAFVDEQVGKVLDALEASPYADNTIIVFTSDNGYHMGEKEYIFKDSLWDESDQIPLVVSAPGMAGAGTVCTQPVSHIDLYPTLVDLCGLPENPNADAHGYPIEGHSLRPLLDDPEGEWSGPPVALTSLRGDTGIHHSVRSERYRYSLCQNGEEELYDHETDPQEWTNRAADPELADVRAELRQQLLDLVLG
jgi:arylsulfatase A-like enzyme